MNKKILIPLAMILTTLLLCVPVSAKRADTVVIGGGWIIDWDDYRANFAFNFDNDKNGQLVSSNHTSKLRQKSTNNDSGAAQPAKPDRPHGVTDQLALERLQVVNRVKCSWLSKQVDSHDKIPENSSH